MAIEIIIPPIEDWTEFNFQRCNPGGLENLDVDSLYDKYYVEGNSVGSDYAEFIKDLKAGTSFALEVYQQYLAWRIMG